MASCTRPRSASRGGRSPAPQHQTISHETLGHWSSVACDEETRPPSGYTGDGASSRGRSPSPGYSGNSLTLPLPAKPASPRPSSLRRRPVLTGKPPSPPKPQQTLPISKPPSPPKPQEAIRPAQPGASPPAGRPPRPKSEMLSTWSSPSSLRTTQQLQNSRGSSQGRRPSCRLAPLDTEAISSSGSRMPSPLARALNQQPVGHLVVLQSIRRSTPSPVRDRFECDGYGEPAAEDHLPETGGTGYSSQQEPPKAPRQSPDVRIGRRRPSLDMGSSSSASRGRSCDSRLGETMPGGLMPGTVARAADDLVPRSAPRLQRCDSLPPTGTSKADEAAATQAKARAIVMLKVLFAEEMAKGGQDANAAAANALRRLKELPRRADAH